MFTDLAPPVPPLTPLYLPDLHALADAHTDWLLQGFVAPGNVTMLISQWKAGKTTLISLLLNQMKAGGQLAGLPVAPGTAAVLSEEGPAYWLQRGRRFDYREHVCWFCRPFRGRPTPQDWQRLVDQVFTLRLQAGLSLLVIDPLAPFLTGSENSADTMLAFLDSLRPLTTTGLAILLAHHPRKRDSGEGLSARGSGALAGGVDILVEMHWYGSARTADRRRRLLAWSRHAQTPRQLVIELNAEADNYAPLGDEAAAEVADLKPVLEKVLGAAADKLTRQDILDLWPPHAHRPASNTLWGWLEESVAADLLRRSGAGVRKDPFRYWLPEREAQWKQDPIRRWQLEQEELEQRLRGELGR